MPGTALCRYDLPAAQRTAHNADAGQPTGTAIRYICSGSEGGRRSREQRGRRPSNLPPRDLAARATLGRQRRPRRPELRESAIRCGSHAGCALQAPRRLGVSSLSRHSPTHIDDSDGQARSPPHNHRTVSLGPGWGVRGNPRGQRSGASVPARVEAAARASSVVADPPIMPHATTLLVRRWDARGGPEGRS